MHNLMRTLAAFLIGWTKTKTLPSYLEVYDGHVLCLNQVMTCLLFKCKYWRQGQISYWTALCNMKKSAAAQPKKILGRSCNSHNRVPLFLHTSIYQHHRSFIRNTSLMIPSDHASDDSVDPNCRWFRTFDERPKWHWFEYLVLPFSLELLC